MNTEKCISGCYEFFSSSFLLVFIQKIVCINWVDKPINWSRISLTYALTKGLRPRGLLEFESLYSGLLTLPTYCETLQFSCSLSTFPPAQNQRNLPFIRPKITQWPGRNFVEVLTQPSGRNSSYKVIKVLIFFLDKAPLNILYLLFYVFTCIGQLNGRQYDLPKYSFGNARKVFDDNDLADVLYTFGVEKSGQLVLHNYPTTLMELKIPRQQTGRGKVTKIWFWDKW